MEDYKKITLDSYEKNASIFSEYFKGVADFDKRMEFTGFIDLLRGKKILDVGCGGGDHALWFKQKGFDVTAIDLSKSMVEIAKNKGVNASVMDMEEMTFNKNSFDGIWVVTSLLHLKKNRVENILSSFSSLLNNNGILFIVLKEGDGEDFYDDKQNGTKRYFSYWQEKEMLALLNKDFELIRFWKQKPRDRVFLHYLMRKKG